MVREERLGPITKRSILSQTAKLYDPLGWLAPVVVRAKIIFQTTWLRHLDWDEPLDETDAAAWLQLREGLPQLEQVKVSRWVRTVSDLTEIHGFADASERAYAAVIYLRSLDEHGRVTTSLITAKTKVAPIKQVSLPRLELCAASLLTRLASHFRELLTIHAEDVHL